MYNAKQSLLFSTNARKRSPVAMLLAAVLAIVVSLTFGVSAAFADDSANEGLSTTLSSVGSVDLSEAQGTSGEDGDGEHDSSNAGEPDGSGQNDPSKPTEAGWFEDESGSVYYYTDPESSPFTGWLQLQSKWYYLDPQSGGALTTGVFKVDGKTYASDDDGVRYQNGWCVVDGARYFADANGVLQSGWKKIDGTWYYLDASQNCAARTGKYQVGGSYYISDDKGAMYESRWVDLDGSRYYASESGALAIGWQWIGNAWYFMDASGVMKKNDWVASSGAWYYLDESGAMATGWALDGDTWYYMNGSGIMLTGWQWVGGAWYYLDGSGAMAQSEWLYYGGAWYYLGESGAMATGWALDGDTWYYMNRSGIMQTGWINLGSWYYLSGSGAMLTGWQWIGGAWYYLGDSGSMATGWLLDGDTWYYLNGSGAMATGWQCIGGSWYYLNGSGAMLTGWQNISGVQYYLYPSGAMASGWMLDGEDWYYFNSSGAKTSGWQLVGGSWYYLDPSNNGIMVSDTMKSIGGATYSFTSSGSMRANCLIELDDGACGYANSSGAVAVIGVFSGSDVILKSSSGALLTGWQLLNGTWFYASSEGVVQKGWLQLGSTWYYLDQNTGAMATGWRTIDGKRYFFNSSGAWVDGGPMGAKAQGYSSRTGYLILVDKSAHTVGVFSGSRNNWSLYLTWQCVIGAPSTPTPSGTFVTSGFKRPHLTTNSNAITCTQISGGYFFHSILSSESELGKSLSHGCVRLPYDGARWIYNNIGAGTTVVIY